MIFDELLDFSDQDNFIIGNPYYNAFKLLVSDQIICPGNTNMPQRYEIAMLYYTSQGGGWKQWYKSDTGCENSPWLSSESKCNWDGVLCNGAGKLQEVGIGKDRRHHGSVQEKV